ncbi:mannitol dehydrogenase family protein [Jannaschia seohaensis]|uniref:Fructuronate reductase n=1 Tax=Jannaschia seohaensis TaxID=475081 RepID=A0A2Y9AZ12_9RHOB|nr:mannitol dehydrogenase family protein [Jannaschia seohaensis]PWJ16140.1 fructuronate reductase [Jannaschia seohaensis]SSA49105.1 fructuronate reductase [Jannaschia seohaensis]
MTRLLHLGLGAFHRAHQAPYTQDAGGWRIEAVSMRDPTLADAIEAAKSYHLLIRAPDGPEARRIDVIDRGHALSRGAGPIADRMAAPEIAAVTLTVTEKGYGLDRATGGPDRRDATTAHDLAHPDSPRGAIGTLLLGLHRRARAGLPPLTVLSCDNLPENGAVLARLARETARITRPGLLPYLDACAFPSSMVDRITPATTEETLDTIARLTGQRDPLTVETEPFSQWVIEDTAAGPLPDWAAAGAQIVPDVAPWEAMKLRMLNGAHSTIAYLGLVAGHAHVRDVMADAALAPQVRAVMETAARTLPRDAGLDPNGYAEALTARFQNPAIAHRCAQIAMDGSQKLPQRLFATVRDLLDRDMDPSPLAPGIAAWLKVLRDPDLPVSDPLEEPLRAAARASDPVREIGRVDGLAGTEIWQDRRWTNALRAAMRAGS